MMQIKKFCWCWTVRTGTLIIGYLSLFSNIIQIAANASLIIENPVDKVEESSKPLIRQLIIMFAIGFVYQIASIFFNVALLWGVYKAKDKFVFPWLALKGLEFGLLIFVFLFSTGYYLFNNPIQFTQLFILIAIFILTGCVEAYIFICVYSYYKQLNVKENDSSNEAPPPYTVDINDKKLLV